METTEELPVEVVAEVAVAVAAPATPSKPLVLLGKDYLTEPEAACYACVSTSQFRKYAADVGIHARTFMGKKVYRKADLQRALEELWQS